MRDVSCVGRGFSPANPVGHGFRRATRARGDFAGLKPCPTRVLLWLMLLMLACAALACENHVRRTAEQITGGNPDRAAAAVRKYGCGSCHMIPGLDGANGLVGPPLERLGRRSYIAGHLANNPDTLVAWIRHPHRFDQVTAMPEMGVGEQEARDIAAYLYTLQ